MVQSPQSPQPLLFTRAYRFRAASRPAPRRRGGRGAYSGTGPPPHFPSGGLSQAARREGAARGAGGGGRGGGVRRHGRGTGRGGARRTRGAVLVLLRPAPGGQLLRA